LQYKIHSQTFFGSLMENENTFPVFPVEIFGEISEHIQGGSDWKSFVLTCKRLYDFNTQKKINRYANHLTTLLKIFPDKPWNLNYLSVNPSFSFNFVFAHPDFEWDWNYLSDNPSLSFDFVLEHPELKW